MLRSVPIGHSNRSCQFLLKFHTFDTYFSKCYSDQIFGSDIEEMEVGYYTGIFACSPKKLLIEEI